MMSTRIQTTVSIEDPHGIEGGDMAQIDTADEAQQQPARVYAEDFPEAVVDGVEKFLGRPRLRGWIHVYAAVVAFIAGAALVMIAALVLLLLTLAVSLVALGLPSPAAHLIAAVAGILISAGLGWIGMNRLKPSNLAPERTIDQLQRDAAAVREQVK